MNEDRIRLEAWAFAKPGQFKPGGPYGGDYAIQALARQVLTLKDDFEDLNERIDRMADATQADLDALTAQAAQISTDLDTTAKKLQAEVDQLSQAHPGLDVSALQAALAPLDAHAVAIGNIVPTPAPSPAPAPTPVPEPAPAPAPAAGGGIVDVTPTPATPAPTEPTPQG